MPMIHDNIMIYSQNRTIIIKSKHIPAMKNLSCRAGSSLGVDPKRRGLPLEEGEALEKTAIRCLPHDMKHPCQCGRSRGETVVIYARRQIGDIHA